MDCHFVKGETLGYGGVKILLIQLLQNVLLSVREEVAVLSLTHQVTPNNRLIVGFNIGFTVRIHGSLCEVWRFQIFAVFTVHGQGGWCLHSLGLFWRHLTGQFFMLAVGFVRLSEGYHFLPGNKMTWSSESLWSPGRVTWGRLGYYGR